MDKYRITGTLAVLLVTLLILVSFPAPGSADNAFVCGEKAAGLFDTTELSTVTMDTLASEFDEASGVFAQGKCSDLKPDYCGMGACKDGWTCKANVNSCMCFPPN